MKKYITKTWIYFLLLSTLVISACSDMDEYKEFIKGGEISYTGRIDSVSAYSGDQRILIKGLFMSDPKVTNCRIFWNGKADSLDIPVERTDNVDTLKQLISLPENLYNFEIYTYDALGNKSVPVYVTGRSYGILFKESMLNKLVASSMVIEGEGQIEWRSIDKTTGAFATEVTYTDNVNKKHTLKFDIDATKSILPNYKPNSVFSYITLYKPDEFCIDTFRTEPLEIIARTKMNKKDWTIIDFSSEHDNGSNGAKNVIDDREDTRWHARVGSNYPHFVTIDLGSEITINQLGVWRTTFENGGDDRAPDRIQFLVSMDNTNWTDLGTYSFNRQINGAQNYVVTPTKARYYKFVGISGPAAHIVLGELDVYGDQ